MEFEIRKIRIVTILFALLELYRVLNIALSMIYNKGQFLSLEELFYTSVSSILLILMALGKWRVTVSIAAAIIIPKFEVVFGSGSISTPLFIYFCVFLAMFHYLNKKLELTKIGNEEIGTQVLDRLYFFLFASYAFLNFLSTLVHLSDPYWLSGDAMEMIFTHPFWGRFYEYFRTLHHSNTSIVTVFMHILTWSVLVTQLLLIPMYIFKFTRKLLIIWFGVLIINIFILMRVVLLPHFTILFFILLFYRKNQMEYGLALLNPSKLAKPLKRFMWTFYGILLIVFLLRTPTISKGTDQVFWFMKEWDTKVWLMKKTAAIGFMQPSVLNADHLASHRRFVLYRVKNNELEMVPYLDKNGRRLSYFPDPLFTENQGLEYIYGNCMAHITGYDSFTYKNSPIPYKFKGHSIDRLITIDYNAQKFKDTVLYYAEFYEKKYPSKNGIVSWKFEDTLIAKKYYKHCK